MKRQIFYGSIVVMIIMLGTFSHGRSLGMTPAVKEVNVSYTAGGVTSKGFIAYDDNIKGKRPAVLVVHEWWGMNDYAKMRARKLAELGYIAMAVDLFGNGKIAVNPTEAQEFTAPFYKDPKLVKINLDAALEKLKEFPQTDPENISAIGYCFGGFAVLNYAKLGADLKGVVSFHGGMGGVPVDKKLLKAKVLLCHGANDKFVPVKDVENFKHKLDSIGVDNSLKIYPDATHAFSNPASTEAGKKFNLPLAYNAEADRNSWNEMKIFLEKVFKK
jgi:dienelactone hydrolase